MRIFIAFPVTDEIVREVTEIQSDLKKILGAEAVKWVNPEQAHVTVEFLGEVSSVRLVQATETLAKAAKELKPFVLEISEVKVFPRLEQPKILYISLRTNHEELARWRARLHAMLLAEGFNPDGKLWRAHLTIGRVLEQSGRLTFNPPKIRPGHWQVNTVALYQSELLPAGPRHTLLQSFPLL